MNCLRGLLLFSIFLWGCGERKPISPGTTVITKPGGAGGSEGVLGSEGVVLSQSVFPHEEGWREPAAHGVFAVEHGSGLCLRCHASDPQPQAQGGAPACRSCHALYPHAAEWVRRENHGAKVLREGRGGCTTQCHGADLAGGFSKVSCNLCHTVFPHRPNWRQVGEHGLFVKEQGKRLCKGCHGDDFQGGQSGVSCFACHASYPHEENWVDPQKHGRRVIQEGRQNCATACHGADLQGGLSGVACNTCHNFYPHPANWAQIGGHGAIAKRDGKNLCKGCHGNDFQGGTSRVSCFACHALYPHAGDWAQPVNHGATMLRQGRNVCATACHGADLRGGLAGVACETCHELYPHPNQWRDVGGHGQYVFETLRGNTARCQGCHGADLRGGRSRVSCFSCHANYPHPEGWDGRVLHGSAAIGAGKATCATANCHGADFGGSARAPSCFNCHVNFPHTLPRWMTPEPFTARSRDRDEGFHGDKFIREINRGNRNACTECHGINYDISMGGVRCTACHTFGVTHIPKRVGRRNIAWSAGAIHGKYFSDHFNSITPNFACGKCHGAPADFNMAQTKLDLENQSECYRCHVAYPHKSFTLGGDFGVAPWEPVVNECGMATGPAHLIYLLNRPPTFTTDPNARNRPAADPNDPSNIAAIQNTCARSSCHFNGARSFKQDRSIGLCTGYCHNPDNAAIPPLPVRPPCPPPPGPGGGEEQEE